MAHNICNVLSLQDKGTRYIQSEIDAKLSKLKVLQNACDQLKQKRNAQSKSLEHSTNKCREDIGACRNELNDDLKKAVLKQVRSQEDEGQQRIRRHIYTLTATSKMLEVDMKLLQDIKTNGESGLRFASDVHVSKSLKDYKKTLYNIVNDAILTDIKFEKNTKLVKMQAEIESVGYLVRSSAVNIQSGRKRLLDSKIQSRKQVNVKLADDNETPIISGSVVMPSGEIMFCDIFNYALKLLDSADTLKDSLPFDTWPWDISIVDTETAIVTLPAKKQLQYIDVFPRLVRGRVLQTNKPCYGIHVTGDKIFTTCHNRPGDGEVRILDLNGTLLQQLGINRDGSFMFKQPSYIIVNPAEKWIFVSDYDTDTITCMTMDNQTIYQYRDDEMKRPGGLYSDNGDNIIVCGEDSNNLQVITAAGEKHCNLVSAIEQPLSISYRIRDNTIIVSCHESNHVLIFKLG